jgi:thiol-disulfide isomerase/thioredoxin
VSDLNVSLFALEHGRVERPFSIGDETELPIRLKTAAPLTPEVVEPFRDVAVRSVWLTGKRHTDRDVAVAADTFPQLADIFVPHGKAITDDAIRALAPVAATFRAFTAYRSQVSDEGAKLLAQLPELRLVRLDQGRLTDDGLEALGQCQDLQGLMLDGNFRIRGRGLKGFVDHPSLRFLLMSGTKIDDDAIGHLAGCSNLERLMVSSTNVTERCLLTLPSERELDVFLPRGVDPERVDQIRRERPNLIVDGLGPDHVVDIPRAEDGAPVELPPQLRGNALTFAVFTSSSCAPCQWLKTTFGQLRPNLREQFKFVEIDIDDHMPLASALHVRSVPTVFVMQFGIELDRFVGAMGETHLTERLEAVLAL